MVFTKLQEQNLISDQNEVIKNPFSKEAGINFALPGEAIEVKNIINNQKLKNFNLSKEIKANIYIYQRIIEFNYPIRINSNSNYTFLLKEENIPNACKKLSNGNFVTLIKCQYD